MIQRARDYIDELFHDGRLIEEALREAVKEALLRHKKAGVPIVSWQDGKVVVIPPEQIPVDESDEQKKPGPSEEPGP